MSCRQSTKIPDLFLLPGAEFGMEMAPRENGKEAGAQYFATSLPCLFATGQSGRQNFRAGRDLRDHIVHPPPPPPVYKYNVKNLSRLSSYTRHPKHYLAHSKCVTGIY